MDWWIYCCLLELEKRTPLITSTSCHSTDGGRSASAKETSGREVKRLLWWKTAVSPVLNASLLSV
eukprot:scaffold33541_cov129-Skeletonema_dohrnii-CCMP3373.AAC.2